MAERPFVPTPPEDRARIPMPSSVPDGLRLELLRSPVVPGQEEEEAAAWMAMLHERYDECVATLGRECSVFESIFLHREADGSWWIYHLSLAGSEGGGLDPEASDLDRAHADFAARVKTPGWEALPPAFMLTPDHLREAMQAWGRTGRAGAPRDDRSVHPLE